MDYKDDATAFNGLKKGTIAGKGVINNRMSNLLMQMLEKNGIPTHFVRELSERETLVKRCPSSLWRSSSATLPPAPSPSGTVSRRGWCLTSPFSSSPIKRRAGDPLLNTSHALALKLATPAEIETIKGYALKIDRILQRFWAECGVTLADFKLEFGRTSDGRIILADEISPDTCRLWDSATGEKLDKDRFRRDLGGVEEAYAEIMKRLVEHGTN